MGKRNLIGEIALAALAAGIVGAILVSIIAGPSRVSRDGVGNFDRQRAIVETLTSFPAIVQSAVVTDYLRPRSLEGTYENIRRIDFSKPSDIAKGDDGWAVFKNSNIVYSDDYGFQIKLSHISSGGEFVFTLGNAITEVGTPKPELIAVVAKLTPEACVSILKLINPNFAEEKDGIPILDSSPSLTVSKGVEPIALKQAELPYIHGSGQIPERPFGCVRHESTLYFYQTLFAF